MTRINLEDSGLIHIHTDDKALIFHLNAWLRSNEDKGSYLKSINLSDPNTHTFVLYPPPRELSLPRFVFNDLSLLLGK